MGDVRARRDATRKEQERVQGDRPTGETLSFRDKMKFFAQQIGEQAPATSASAPPEGANANGANGKSRSKAQQQLEAKLAAQGFLSKDS